MAIGYSDKRFELFDIGHRLFCGNIAVERKRVGRIELRRA